jgi:histidinol dehydrogenase
MVVLVDDREAALAVSNELAPEHLELMCADADLLVALVRHAGAVFVGESSPAAIGDYVAGANHVLPTGGTARFAGALRVSDFEKRTHVVTLDRATLTRVGTYAATLAEAEGLAAHAQSIRIREGRA